ncbi:MAG TPA: hemerythrin domain-containing protein [Pyrinomonadaceae bacterium]|nr:hemerythrin domain-containing protein [Pyrinomonadaceae bacterium]
MNPFQLLKNDHQIVSGLFDQIESASGGAKTQLFNRLKSELDVHALIEEKIFYPALENKKESREITLEAYEEHKVVKDLLSELANGSAADEEWDAKLKVLRENVDHHVEEEEGELFDKANDVLSDEALDRLGDEMEAEKARQMGQTPPRAGRAASNQRGDAKSSGSRKQAGSPGVLSRLANFVGLGTSESARKGSAKGGKKKAAKGSKTGAAKKSGGKAAAKKAGVKKATKAAGKSTKGSSSKGRGSRKAASKGASKKSTKSSGGAKRKTGGSKKR